MVLVVVLKCAALHSISKILILNTVIVEVQIKSNFQIVLFSMFCCLTLLLLFFLVVGELNSNTFSLGRLNKQSDKIPDVQDLQNGLQCLLKHMHCTVYRNNYIRYKSGKSPLVQV